MDTQQCIDNCLECHRVCLETALHCFQRNQYLGRGFTSLLLGCSQICAINADLVEHYGGCHANICAECADICTECAAECERLADGDPQMLRCAKLCRRAAYFCDDVVIKVAA